MRADRVVRLRQETVDMFYHGYDNYMKVAFPEDEVRHTPPWCAFLAQHAADM